MLRELSPGLCVEIKYRPMINMGAACSSSSKKKYNDAINYLKSKSCMTFTYSRGFSPLAKNMPHVILVGENHFENPPITGNCGTISGLLNELVSICKDPVSRLTIFTEDEPDDDIQKVDRSTIDVFSDMDNDNPFNVNSQKVILDQFERKYGDENVHIIRSDIFFSARSQFLHEDVVIFEDRIHLFTIFPFKLWAIDLVDTSLTNMDIIESEGSKLSKKYMSGLPTYIQEDMMLHRMSEFGHMVLLFLKMNETRIFHSGVYNFVAEQFYKLFNGIIQAYSPPTTKRKRTNVDTHNDEIGTLITFIGDALNFYKISTMDEGIVLVSYGQEHTETFKKLLDTSMLYNTDYMFGSSIS